MEEEEEEKEMKVIAEVQPPLGDTVGRDTQQRRHLRNIRLQLLCFDKNFLLEPLFEM